MPSRSLGTVPFLFFLFLALLTLWVCVARYHKSLAMSLVSSSHFLSSMSRSQPRWPWPSCLPSHRWLALASLHVENRDQGGQGEGEVVMLP